MNNGSPAGPPDSLSWSKSVFGENALDAAECFVDQVPLELVGTTHFDRYCWDTVVARLSSEGSVRALPGDDDVRGERPSEPFDVGIVHVRPDVKHVVSPARRSVEIEDEITRLDEVGVDPVGHAPGARSGFVAGKGAIEVTIENREIPLLGEETGDVEYRETDDRAVEIGVIPLVGHSPNDLDPVEFVAMGRGGQARSRAGLLAVDDRDGDSDWVTEVGLAHGVADVRRLSGGNRPAVVGKRRGRVGHSCHCVRRV